MGLNRELQTSTPLQETRRLLKKLQEAKQIHRSGGTLPDDPEINFSITAWRPRTCYSDLQDAREAWAEIGAGEPDMDVMSAVLDSVPGK